MSMPGGRVSRSLDSLRSRLRKLAQRLAKRLGLDEVVGGTYVCIPGPSLETPAETRFLRMIGGDAVGMSSVPEILVALHAGMRVLGLSVVANVNDPIIFSRSASTISSRLPARRSPVCSSWSSIIWRS
jgi:purine nucleoside phosphorylase